MSVGLGVSLGIFGLIAAREWLPEWLKIWHIMLAGAIVMLLAGEISPRDALASVDWNIIAYLFAVFSIGTSLYINGISHQIADRLVGLGSAKMALAAFIVCFAGVAAIVTNDAAAIIGAPIAFVLAARTGVDPKIFLIALCVTVTVGSMATPIGNPQNLLIAESGDLPAPLFTFLAWLIIPTVISLAMAAWWFSYSLKSDGSGSSAVAERASVSDSDEKLWPSLVSVGLLGVLVTADSLLSVFDPEKGIPLGLAACVACVPVCAFDRRRKQTFLGLDWPTLVFFCRDVHRHRRVAHIGLAAPLARRCPRSDGRPARYRRDRFLWKSDFLERSARRHVPEGSRLPLDRQPSHARCHVHPRRQCLHY